MKKRLMSAIFVLIMVMSILIAACSNRQQLVERPLHSTSQKDAKEDRIRRSETGNLAILSVDSIGSTNNLKAQLNSDSNIKLIHHNRNDKSHYYDHEVVVDFKVCPDSAAEAQILRDIDGVVKEKLDSVYIFKSNSISPDQLVQYFTKNKNVSFAEPHYIYIKNEVNVNDAFYQSYQWNLPAIGTEDGWSVTRGSKKIIIAIVDTGVDLTHPDLSGRIIKGYNALDKTAPPEDDNGHGTHVAGIIAADTNNHIGVAGISWYNPIMPVKVMDSKGSGGSFDVAEGIRWAVKNGADVINLSLGNYQQSAVMQDAIKYALKKNVVVVSAAGNDNTNQPSYPAAYPDVIGVAAVDRNGNRATFSNYGNYVDVAAPGVNIASTYNKNRYASLSGTSMAAPHVTALAALIRSVNPSLKPKEVQAIITKTTQKTTKTSPNPYYGYGIIDNVGALEYVYMQKYPNGQGNNGLGKLLNP